MIRHATREDIGTIVGMGRRFHTVSRLPVPYDPAYASLTAARFIEDEDKCALVLGKVGVFLGSVANHPFFPLKWAQEALWWVDADHRGQGSLLLDGFEEWARDQAAELVGVIALDGSLGSALERRDYRLFERHYVKAI